MRILILLFLLAGVGVGYFALRDSGGTVEPDSGTGPATSVSTAAEGRGPLELERGSAPVGSREVNVAPGSTGTADAVTGAASPPAAATDAVGMPSVPEPTFEGGVTTQPVGTTAPTSADDEFALKYANASHLERTQALATLRTIFETRQQTTDKALQRSFDSMKLEMSWLEANLDG